jgi:hypothetical protein
MLLSGAQSVRSIHLQLNYDKLGLQLLNISDGNLLAQGDRLVALVHREDLQAGALDPENRSTQDLSGFWFRPWVQASGSDLTRRLPKEIVRTRRRCWARAPGAGVGRPIRHMKGCDWVSWQWFEPWQLEVRGDLPVTGKDSVSDPTTCGAWILFDAANHQVSIKAQIFSGFNPEKTSQVSWLRRDSISWNCALFALC